MESTTRGQEDDAKRETPADAAPCQTCRLAAGVAAAMATIVLVIGLLVSLILFVTLTAAPEVDQTPKTSGKELLGRLQQCQKDCRDLNLMLRTVTQGKVVKQLMKSLLRHTNQRLVLFPLCGDSRCSVCPHGWLWWRGHCYFFSVGLQENRRWNKSAEFCQQHNSSLAVIKDFAEMDFIQGVMTRFSQFPFLWVGLTDTEQEGRWLWWDGTDLQHYMPVTVEWDADHRDCADLRGGGSLFAVVCEAYGPWVCKRES